MKLSWAWKTLIMAWKRFRVEHWRGECKLIPLKVLEKLLRRWEEINAKKMSFEVESWWSKVCIWQNRQQRRINFSSELVAISFVNWYRQLLFFIAGSRLNQTYLNISRLRMRKQTWVEGKRWDALNRVRRTKTKSFFFISRFCLLKKSIFHRLITFREFSHPFVCLRCANFSPRAEKRKISFGKLFSLTLFDLLMFPFSPGKVSSGHSQWDWHFDEFLRRQSL